MAVVKKYSVLITTGLKINIMGLLFKVFITYLIMFIIGPPLFTLILGITILLYTPIKIIEKQIIDIKKERKK